MDLLNRLAPSRQSTEKLTIGQQFERSFAGEALISVFVLLAVLIGVVWNLPKSHIKEAMTPTLRPVATATGLQQHWQMYAPDPISAREDLEVRVSMADGMDRVWAFRKGDRLLGPFIWYRWQKLKEQVIREPRVAEGLSLWVVRELTQPGDQPIRVTVTFYLESLPAPGQAGPIEERTEILHSEDLDGRR